ncbi:MAG TPA: hypothetical protein VEZ46_10370 [Mycobacteriales bacterium]|jgi:hypothetical protein|nr:hypothetical protein [Mycobacteriales bacterium]
MTAGTLDRFATQVGGTSAHDETALLRAAIRIDAVITAAVGAGLLAGAAVLDGVLGTPTAFLAAVGAGMIAWGGLWFVARRPRITGPAREIVAANALWVVLSGALHAAGWHDLTAVGTAFVLLQAAIVAGFIALQVAGLRRIGRSTR